ncbi:MAG TPA: phosphoribosylaminoimidazolesuccinocarboxamide synthase, partial [Pyrinomonadaceae bacterium]|nr:phosphoribosylaminoimidazolesuccinocarboxamide synthase [Pyrinomonadaceae bacterium]
MTGAVPILETSFSDLRLVRRGKVRDVYEVDDDHLLIVATDRISAFDCILPTPIERKGEVLTALSRFWFGQLAGVVTNHLVSTEVEEMPEVVRRHRESLRARSMLVRRTDVFPVECVVRGYLAGSGWKDYLRTGAICGHQLPEGLRESEQLPRPIFTPATKAESGHDENIDEARMGEILGPEVAETLRDIALRLYTQASEYARTRGIIIADT